MGKIYPFFSKVGIVHSTIHPLIPSIIIPMHLYYSIHSIEFVLYLVLGLFLTPAIVLAANKSDPRQYNKLLDVFRGICEGVSILVILITGVIELLKMILLVEYLSCILVIIVIML